MTLGQVIRERRIAKGFSLRDMAKYIRLSPAYLSLVERDQTSVPTETTIRKLAEGLDLDPDTLLAAGGRLSFDIVSILLRRPDLIRQLRQSV